MRIIDVKFFVDQRIDGLDPVGQTIVVPLLPCFPFVKWRQRQIHQMDTVANDAATDATRLHL